MHFEFLTEDQSAKKAMSVLIPKMLGKENSFRIHPYKGIGHVPKGLHPKSAADQRILLDQLPRLMRGYGQTPNCGVVVVICDLDDKDRRQFISELNAVLDTCNPKPRALFCLAIEEFEAWYLGDLQAIQKAYPHAKKSTLDSYVNDSICGTWELLADVVYKGGHAALSKKGRQEVGKQKSVWAETITPHMRVDFNRSPSFMAMYKKLRGAMRRTAQEE